MLILAIGDFFIPDRAIDLPFKFRKLLNPSYGNNKSTQSQPTHAKIGKVLCLGNIINSNETLKFLHGLSPNFNIVRGEFDNPTIISQQLQNITGGKPVSPASSIPLYSTINVEGLRIGFTNGYQVLPRNDPLSLSAFAREVDVDIVIWGGTHKVEAYTLDGRFFVNPGSATGAYGFDWPESDDGEFDEEEETNDKDLNEPVNEEESAKDDVNDEEIEESQTEEGDKAEVETESKPEIEVEVEKEQSQADPEPLTKAETESVPQDPNSLTDDSVELSESDMNKLIEMKSSIPSFCLLDIQGTTCTLYIYTYLNDEIKVDKVTFQKENK